MRVDYYTATIPDAEENGPEILAWVADALPGDDVEVSAPGSINNWKFSHGFSLLEGRRSLAAVRWGGNGGGVSIECKGSVAPDMFGLIRSHFPDHLCSRMDVAVDRAAPTLFDDQHSSLLAIAGSRTPKVQVRREGDWDWRIKPGRSAYFGSSSSDVQVVLYEKGHQLMALGQKADPEHVRLECRVHPTKRASKALLASLTPSEVWGWSKWTSAALASFTGSGAPLVDLPERVADFDRTLNAIARQYGRFVGENFDSPESFAQELDRRMRHFAEARRVA